MSAARYTYVLMLLAALAAGCASAPRDDSSMAVDFSPEATARSDDPLYNMRRVVLDDVTDPLAVDDPLEPFNRTIYRFNALLDRTVLMPTVRAYRRFVPRFLRSGVSNFFDNLDNLTITGNQILQARPKRALESAGRLLVNTTLGFGGVLDVADHAGLPDYEEDFGQTLGAWGVPAGPYLVLPLFGPSSVRDGLGSAVDSLALTQIDPLRLQDRANRRYLYYPLLVIDTRSETAFQYYQTGSPFEYELLRLLYLEKRDLDVVR
ncbi:MAG: VacJ family lipoprotein [Pseudomonadota bacterium]